MSLLAWIWILIAGHSLADTVFQPDAMGRGKNRNREIDLSRVPKGQKPLNLWPMWLTHHSLIHGLVVYLLTGKVFLGMIETCSHWIIDFGKCDNLYDPYMDQFLHIGVKVMYAMVLMETII